MLKNSKYSILATVVIIGAAASLYGYLTWYVSPDYVTERVRIVANTADGCIAESSDGFSVNIGPCDAEPGDHIVGTYDAKIKERRAMMNPTT